MKSASEEEFVPADKLPPGVKDHEDHEMSEAAYHDHPREKEKPPLKELREVDMVARSMLDTVHRLMEYDGVKIPLTSEDYRSISVGAWIELRFRHRPVDYLDVPDLEEPGIQIIKPPEKAPPPDEQRYDTESMEPSTPDQRRRFYWVIDSVQKHLVGVEGVVPSEAVKRVRKLCATEYEKKYGKPIPAADQNLEYGPISYLMSRMEDTWPDAFKDRRGG